MRRIFMNNLIETFINNMKREDIINFAHKNNLTVTDHEIDFVYSFIKNNYHNVLKNPNNFNLALYKQEFSQENYTFIEKLITKYKKML